MATRDTDGMLVVEAELRADPGSAVPGAARSGTGRWMATSLGLLVAAAILAIVPMQVSNAVLDLVNGALIASIGALALNLLLGHTGLVSIGNAAFLAIGALTAALVANNLEMSFGAAMLAGGLVSAFIGLLLAIPSLRIKGLYLAMATLAFHFLAIFVVREIQRGQVGSSGFRMPRASLFGWEIHGLKTWYVFLVVMLGLALLFTRTVLVRKPGRAWRAIRGGPALAAMSGISVWRYKIWAFVISSFMIGVAGAILGYYTGSVSYETFTLHMAIVYLAYVIIGGMGSIYGPIVGVFFLFLLPTFVEWLRGALNLERVISSSEIFFVQGAMIGVAIVVMILVEPLGLAALGKRALHWVDQRVLAPFRSATRGGAE